MLASWHIPADWDALLQIEEHRTLSYVLQRKSVAPEVKVVETCQAAAVNHETSCDMSYKKWAAVFDFLKTKISDTVKHHLVDEVA
jgi:hypothetical protein